MTVQFQMMQYQTEDAIHPKSSIEANDLNEDTDEFVALRRARRSDRQLDMVGTKAVVGAIAWKKGKLPVLSGVVGNEDIRKPKYADRLADSRIFEDF